MVAIRGSHLNDNADFTLEIWVAVLDQGPVISQVLIDVYHHCLTLGDDTSRVQPLWRGREMVEILVTLSMDKETLQAALLFPMVEDGLLDRLTLTEVYGNTIARLVCGVEEMAAIHHFNATTKEAVPYAQVDNVRRMLLSMVADFRCVVIKLAERISHLREVKNKSDEIRQSVAKECTNIYAPLANRLGIGQLKWEIEDYAFRYQHSATYKKIAKKLAARRIERMQYIDKFVVDLQEAMASSSINAQVDGRPKHIYSIWLKMQEKNLEFEELFDVRAIRIITDHLQDCYAALGIVHTKYRHLPKEFDDYVANPKPNGYQSIHTVVLGPKNQTVEIQIRTRHMHDEAELGVAAHWKYKEGSSIGRRGYDEKITWLRKLLAWQKEVSDSGTILDELHSQVLDDRIYVFTPRGDVVDLPTGATPLDFAYYIHSEVGHRCIGAKVGGRIVPFMYHLSMGDQVEIITQKEPNPSRDWLNPNLGFVTSGRARAKINAWFRKQAYEKNVVAGKEILDMELVKISAVSKDVTLAMKRFNVNSIDEIYAGVGSGDLRINQVVNYINSLLNKPTKAEEDQQLRQRLEQTDTTFIPKKPRRDVVVVKGVDNLMIHLARCCQPIPRDAIEGYVTQGRGISVHRADCDQLSKLRHHASERIIETVWGRGYIGSYQICVRVSATERNGLIKDLNTVLTNERVKVSGMRTRIDYKKEICIMDFDLELSDLEVLSRVISRLQQVKEVHGVKRLH
ncbi:GTP diphosphokinase [Candidatus Enterovibrio escicola]|uniref:GTP diphosphokinase n=1 Tax=Candidatus Enterovibrio escicola TaxID=1927127 RepID=UPI001237D804|nr:GTP diphosphokinase [Candidatus Enterovibrio escacola]